MAGSLKYFLYTTTGGATYPVRMDESNGEAIGNPDYTAASTVSGLSIPRNIEPRYVLYRSLDGFTTRKIIVCSSTADLEDLPLNFTVPSPVVGGTDITVFRQSLVGEKQRAVLPNDTGLTDGDDT